MNNTIKAIAVSWTLALWTANAQSPLTNEVQGILNQVWQLIGTRCIKAWNTPQQCKTQNLEMWYTIWAEASEKCKTEEPENQLTCLNEEIKNILEGKLESMVKQSDEAIWIGI